MKRSATLLEQWFLPAAASTLVATLGLAAFSGADPKGAVADLLPGTYQRVYEERFESALPFRDTAVAAWTATRLALFGEVSAGALITDSGILFTTEEFLFPDAAPDFGLELATARDGLAARGIALIPLIVPDKARMLAGHHDFPRAEALTQRYDWALGQLAQAGLPALDLRPALADLGDAAYFRTDTHWTPEGAAAVAAALARAQAQIIGDSGFQTERLTTAPFDGDLLRYAQTGPFAAWVGPAPETVSLYETTGTDAGLGLFDEAAVPVILVGTSFSAREDLHFDGFLKSALKLDVLNLAVQGEGPFAPMQRLLSGDSLNISPPQIVIWEIPERFLDPRTLK